MSRTKKQTSPYRLRRGNPEELSQAWQPIHASLPDKNYLNALTALIYFLSRREIDPHQVNDGHIDEFVLYLAEHNREPAVSLANSAVEHWSQLHNLDLPPLKRRPDAKSRREDAWMARGAAINDSIEDYIETRKAGLADEGQHERNALRLATHIVADVTGPVTAIEDLLPDDAIDVIVYDDGVRQIKDATRHAILGALRTYSKKQLKKYPSSNKAGLYKDAIKTTTELMNEMRGTGALPMETVRRLIPFDAPGKYKELLHPCVRMIDALPSSQNRKHDIPRAEAALAIILSVARLRKPGNITNAVFSGAERITETVRRPTLGDGIENGLGPSILALIDRFYLAFAALCGRPPQYLSEKIVDGQRDGSTVAKSVRQLLVEFGFDLTFCELSSVGIKRLIAKGYTAEAIADAAGFATTAAFRKRFAPLLDAAAAQDLDDTLNTKNTSGNTDNEERTLCPSPASDPSR